MKMRNDETNHPGDFSVTPIGKMAARGLNRQNLLTKVTHGYDSVRFISPVSNLYI